MAFHGSMLTNSTINKIIDWVSRDADKFVKVLELHNKMLQVVLHDLESRGFLSDEAKADIESARKRSSAP